MRFIPKKVRECFEKNKLKFSNKKTKNRLYNYFSIKILVW